MSKTTDQNHAERDARLAVRNGSDDRADRSMADRTISESRELSDGERLEAFRNSFFQSALPDLPKIPGYHVCWLTTANPRDPIHARIRLGYTPIKGSDIPGWDHAALKSGEFAGCIGVNEMIAAKIDLQTYEMYMHEAHHTQPMQEEEKLSAVVDTIREEAKRKRLRLEIGDGSESLGKGPRRGSFEDVA